MKRLIQLATIIAVTGAVAYTTRAELITGNLGLTGGVTLNTSSAGTATVVTSWIYPQVNLDDGTFATAPYAVALGTPMNFTTAIWNFNTSTPITNFWSVGGFHFELLSSAIINQGSINDQDGYIFARGIGIVSGNGFTPTAFTWSFTTQDPKSSVNPDSWTFSAASLNLNSNGAPVLVSQQISNQVVVAWSDPTFTLQAAPTVAGAFTNVPNAASPYTNSATGLPQFFRLNQ